MRARYAVAVLLCLAACKTLVCSAQSAAVVGVGVHGLLAAIELKQRGWNVTIFEKEADILPVVPSINLNGINYEYYSQAIYSPATYEGIGSNPALVRFATAYNQSLPQPWEASGIHNTLYYDTVTGPVPFPPVWAPVLESPQGGMAVAQQLAEAVALLREVGTNASVPADLIDSGVAEANESVLQWAQRNDLPAYAGITEVWWNAVRATKCAPRFLHLHQ